MLKYAAFSKESRMGNQQAGRFVIWAGNLVSKRAGLVGHGSGPVADWDSCPAGPSITKNTQRNNGHQAGSAKMGLDELQRSK